MSKKTPQNAFPFFLEGLDQAICYLYQDADYAHLVTAQPEKNWAIENMQKCLKKHIPSVKPIFFTLTNGDKIEFHEQTEVPLQNPYLKHERKKANFAILVTQEKICSAIRNQAWARKAEYA